MADSSDSVSVDMESIPLAGKVKVKLHSHYAYTHLYLRILCVYV